MKSIKPGKQRKELFNAPLHRKRKWISAHLEENLLLKYDRRAIPVIKGDTVKVMKGSFRGHEDKVVRINVKKNYVEVEGLTMTKADGKKIAKPMHPSNLLITKLNLTDTWRRRKLERELSEETKKEIEKEAEEQLREQGEEQKRIEAEEKLLEDAEKEELEEPKEPPKVKEATVKKETTEQKKQTEKKVEHKTKVKKKTAKKTPVKKTATKKKKEVKK
jgi:large subunit ribosomal protein L24